MMQRLVSTFVISRMEYCNFTLAGLPACALEPLQRVLHATVRVVAGLGPRDNVRKSVKDLYWLPIAHCIKFKVCTLMHEAMFGKSPSCIRDLSFRVVRCKVVHVYVLLLLDSMTFLSPNTVRSSCYLDGFPFGVEQSSSQYQTDSRI